MYGLEKPAIAVYDIPITSNSRNTQGLMLEDPLYGGRCGGENALCDPFMVLG
jgi:hypothetical protein